MFKKEKSVRKCYNMQEVIVPNEVVEMVRAYRNVTQLPLGKLDLVRETSSNTYWSVDPGTFPGFINWPDAASLLVNMFLEEIKGEYTTYPLQGIK